MRVLIVHPHMAVYGGAETVVKKLSDCLTATGVANAVATLSVTEEVRRFCPGIEFLLPEGGGYKYMVRSSGVRAATGLLKEVSGLRDLIRRHEERFDIVNVHNFPATWAARGSKRPVVWMANEPPELWNNSSPSALLKAMFALGVKVDRSLVNKAVQSICVADEFNRERIRSRYGRASEIIPYGIEYGLFSTGDGVRARKRYGLEDAFVVLQAGMLTPQKNQLASVRALEELSARFPDVVLVLAGLGGSEYEKEVRALVASSGLEERVVFTGHVNKDELKDLYHASDVAVFPVGAQGGWLAPFEAMTAGKPVVVSSVMGAAGLIEREDLGTVTGDYATAIAEVHREPERFRSRAEHSREWVRENLTWERFTERMVEVFKSTSHGRNL